MRLALLLILFILASCTTNVNAPYYRNPLNAGYNTQVVGAKCPQCGRVGLISWNQIDNLKTITCFYCRGEFDTKQGIAMHTYDSEQRQRQIYDNAIINAMDGMNKQQASRCQHKNYTIYDKGTTKFCTQYANCSVYCQ